MTANNSSVDQVFDVLALLSGADEPIGVAQLARILDVPASTAHRVLITLDEAGYVSRDASGTKYQLGVGAQELAHSLLGRFPIQAASQPYLRQLAASTGETAVLTHGLGFYSVRIAAVEGTNDVHAAPRLGETTLLESSTAGRAILAFAERDLVSRYLSWTKKKSGTKMPPDAAAIRKQGYALDTAEDRFELAVPVVDADGEVIAAITLEAGDASKESTRIARTRAAAKQLEKLLVERPELAFDPFGHLPLEERYPGFDPVGS